MHAALDCFTVQKQQHFEVELPESTANSVSVVMHVTLTGSGASCMVLYC